MRPILKPMRFAVQNNGEAGQQCQPTVPVTSACDRGPGEDKMSSHFRSKKGSKMSEPYNAVWVTEMLVLWKVLEDRAFCVSLS